jgi:hypothetical protein
MGDRQVEELLVPCWRTRRAGMAMAPCASITRKVVW